MGTPTLNASGIIAVATHSACVPSTATPGAYLLNATTGEILATLPVNNSKVFAQPIFGGNDLYLATETSGLYAYAP